MLLDFVFPKRYGKDAALDILIANPTKTERSYSFDLTIRDPKGEVQTRSIGIHDANFDIPHHEVWDSFLPLMYITRNGGPLYNKPISRANVRADFPLHATVAQFFEKRADKFGLSLQIDSPVFDQTYDVKTKGDRLLFGGGKDSRLMLGTLHEIGVDATIVSAKGATYAADFPDALTFETLDFSMPNRIVPALMMCPERVWHGSGLGEVHLSNPWQQYFDISAKAPLFETCQMLGSLGFDIEIKAPQNILPYNVAQAILAKRYPDLYVGQQSVNPEAPTDKNLHVALIKMYHGLSIDDHCSPALFNDLLQKFVRNAGKRKSKGFGFHGHREVIEREMRAIILHFVRSGDISLPKGLKVPDSWEAPWIDHVHAYIKPDVDPRLLEIYTEYAEPWQVGREGLPDCLAPYVADPMAQ